MYAHPQLYSHPSEGLRSKLLDWNVVFLSDGTKFCVLTAEHAQYEGNERIYVLSGKSAGAYLWIARSSPNTDN